MKSNQNHTFVSHLQLFFLLSVLIITGLQIPKISNLAFFCLLIWGFINYFLPFTPILKVGIALIKKTKFVFCLVILSLFAFVYFKTAYDHGFLENYTRLSLLVSITFPSIFYLMGACINYHKLPYRLFNYCLILLAIIGGSVLFVYLSVSTYNHGSLESFLIVERKIPSFWGVNEDPINGPTIDLFSILGVVLLPVILDGRDKDNKQQKLWFLITIIIVIIFLLSLYSSISLQARTPAISLVISCALAIISILVKNKNKAKIIWIILLISSTIFLLYSFNVIIQQLISFYSSNQIFVRLETQGLQSNRYDLWKAVLQGMWDYPWGGREISLPHGEEYAHNLWLDTAYDSGLFPMTALILFHILHIKPLIKVCCSSLPKILTMLVMFTALGFLMGFIGTPVLQASRNYFAISCFFLGLVMRIYADIKFNQQKNIMITNDLKEV